MILKNKLKEIILRKNKTVKDSDLLKDYSVNEDIKLQNGSILSNLISQKKDVNNLEEVEFKIFSQWGDDGIIQYLINRLTIQRKVFVEFGVEDYLEANTRFLLMHNNWSGLVMDGNYKYVENIKRSSIYWKYDLIAKQAFVTAENINDLLIAEGFEGQIGLLHIDIDGNDYWIWSALDVVMPDIMIVEYNSVFGHDRPITVPYRPDFIRTKAHYSNLYAGSSILSLCDLAESKGYAFIGSNSAGNNAYFIKKKLLNDLRPLSAKDGYVESKFRESRNENGSLNFLRGNDRLKSIKGLPVYNTRKHEIEII